MERKVGWYWCLTNLVGDNEFGIYYWDGKYWYGINYDGQMYDSDFKEIDETPIVKNKTV